MKARSLLVLVVAVVALVSAACGSSGGSDSDGGSKTTTTKASSSTTEAMDSSTTEAMDSSTTTAGSTDGSPTDAEVSTAVQKAFNVSADRGDCAAPKLRKDVSAESLAAIAHGKQDEVPSGELDAVKAALQDALAACP